MVSSLSLRALGVSFLMALGASSATASWTASLSYDPAIAGYSPDRGYVAMNGSKTGATYVYADPNDFVSQGIVPLATAYGDDDGHMGANIDMWHGGEATATSIWSHSFVNTSGAAQNFQMNIALTDLSFSVVRWGYPEVGNLYTGFFADVLVNGVSVWQSGQTFVVDYDGYQVSKTGFDIGNASVTAFGSAPDELLAFALNDYLGTIDLGFFASGETINIEYSLSAFASWDDPMKIVGDVVGIMRASVVDPFNLTGSDRIVMVGGPQNSVPEPGVFALLGIGLAGLGVCRRRRS